MKKAFIILILTFTSIFLFGQNKKVNLPNLNSNVFTWENMEVIDVPYIHKMADNLIDTYFPTYKEQINLYCIGMAEGNKLESDYVKQGTNYNAYSFHTNKGYIIAINMNTCWFDKSELDVLIVHEIAHLICHKEGKTDLNHDTPLWISLRKSILAKSNNKIDIDKSIHGHYKEY